MAKKILIDVDIKATEALKELADLKLKAQELREEQKKLDTSTQEGMQRYQALGQQIKAINKASQEREKTIQNEIKKQNEASDSLQAMKAKLSLLTAEYNKLSKADRESAKGQGLQAQIKATSDELLEAEKALGNFHRQVGNYEIATKNLKKEMRELTEQLINMKLNGQENSAVYKEMSSRLAELKDAMSDVNQETSNLASDTHALNQMVDTVQTLTASYGAYKSVLQLAGIESEEFEETMKKLQAVMVALNSLQTIQNALQKQSNFYKLAESVIDKLRLKQRVRLLAIQQAQIGATKALTVQQWLLNAAMNANPAGLILLAIIALIAAIYALTKAFSKSAKAQEAANKANEEYEKQVEKTARAVEDASNREKNALKSNEQARRKLVNEMKKQGKSAEEIAKAESDATLKGLQISIHASKEKIQAMRKQLEKGQEDIRMQKALLATMREGSKKYEEQVEKIKKLEDEKDKLIQSMKDEANAVKDNAISITEEAQKRSEEEKKIAFDKYTKLEEYLLKFNQNILNLNKKYYYDRTKSEEENKMLEFQHTQEYERKMFQLEQQSQKNKLEAQRKYGELTQEEYRRQMSLLNQEARIFAKGQADDMAQFMADRFKSVISALGKTYDQQINEVKRKYGEMLQTLKQSKELSDEELAYYELEIEYRKDEELKQIQKTRLDLLFKRATESYSEQYEKDILAFAMTEEEKLRLQKEYLQRQYEQAVEIYGKESKQALQYQNQLKATELQSSQNAMAKDLANNNLTAKKKHDITLNYLNDQLSKGLISQTDYNERVKEADQELTQARVESVENYAQQAMELMSGVNELINTLAEAEVSKAEEKNTKEKEALDKRLKSGIISQKQYDAQVEKLDKELDEQKADIARKQAKREKAMSVFQIGLNTAMAIMKIWAEVPKADFAATTIALTALVSALGAVQLATAIAQPLPKASRGALLHGKSHAEGGIPIEAEGGEAIINKRSTAMFKPLLSAINEVGGGVRFASGGVINDGGYSARHLLADYTQSEVQSSMMADVVASQKVYVTVEDIRRGEKEYANIENGGKL